ncbi:UpxY family transcription antiterminator [Segatella bryantii]|uniref:UpxY family transcription antiterminator n=1 Tax=Segatella bryantii TaxID=77095 RepID=UPI001EDA5665|nr:UpxY family transcription antiterminator [Segatella bryantii]UKK82224.1 UpxY family transcription antiterminator [Segatella bryantii]
MESVIRNDKPWLAVKLFSLKTYEIRDFLKEMGINCFLPEQYVDIENPENHRIKHILKPVTRNLLFIEKPEDMKHFPSEMAQWPFKMAIIKPHPTADHYAEISSREMREFEEMCNPELRMKIFLTPEEARLKSGDKVLVTNGPMKGMTGRLVRKSKKYYLLKDMPGISIMIKVSRWCCKPTEKE